jgi:hypothetical protein
VTRLNDLLDLLVEDGCFDHAQILVQILEDEDLLREDALDDLDDEEL